MTEILLQLRPLFTRVLGLDEVSPDERFIDIVPDELDRLDFFISVEEEFGVDFSDDDLDHFTIVADLVTRIETLTKGESTHGAR